MNDTILTALREIQLLTPHAVCLQMVAASGAAMGTSVRWTISTVTWSYTDTTLECAVAGAKRLLARPS